MKNSFCNGNEGRLAVISVFRIKTLVFSWEQVFSAKNYILTSKLVTLRMFKWKILSHMWNILFCSLFANVVSPYKIQSYRLLPLLCQSLKTEQGTTGLIVICHA